LVPIGADYVKVVEDTPVVAEEREKMGKVKGKWEGAGN